MADEKGKWLKYFQSVIISTADIPISYLQPILSDIDAHPITKKLQKLELGKVIFTVSTAAILSLIFYPKFQAAAAQAYYWQVYCFLIGIAVIWIGMLFQFIYIELVGITLNLCLFCFLVGSFLPTPFFWACSLPATLFLVPLIYPLLKPQPAPATDGMYVHDIDNQCLNKR